jgi:Collagenase and related proteases
MINKPEILSPAGNFEKMRFAIHYGADAVYLAGKTFGMRTASDNFDDNELVSAIAYAHERGVKVYVTVNIMPRPDEEKLLPAYLSFLNESSPDALIVSDIGVFSLARRFAPDIDIHISTQANTVNAASCRMWHSLGAKRIVLARELSFPEIKMIKENIPEDLELEAFVHGSMCISYSGRCLLSNFYTGRDANRGMCAQPCRWEYMEGAKYAEVFERKRPEERLSVIENESGTYLFSSKDLCMIEHIPELVESGINSLKIEGRVKSAYYAAVTANAYQKELKAYLSDRTQYQFNPESLRELQSVSHRTYGTGFFYDNPIQKAQVTDDGGYIRDKAFLASVVDYDETTNRAILFQRNKMCIGDQVELVSPGMQSRPFVITDMKDTEGNPIDCAPHPKMLFSINTPFPVKEWDIVRGL